MTTANYINISLEIWGSVMCLTIYICVRTLKKTLSAREQVYLRMLLSNIGTLMCDALALYFRGQLGTAAWWGVRIFNFGTFFFEYLLMLLATHYFIEFFTERKPVSRKPLNWSRGIFAMALGLLILNLFRPFYYSIGPDNLYRREPFYFISIAIGLVNMILCTWLFFCNRKILSRHEKLAFSSYIFLPTAALLVQMFLYGIVLAHLATTIVLTIVFLFLQVRQRELVAQQTLILAEQNRELTNAQTAILLSQIQPHFIFNVLNSIYYLCGCDPKRAQREIKEFSTYLRFHMDALEKKDPVSFRDELNHTETYLSLEKMRFGSKLSVEYDIETMDFYLPVLTVQPLVENAVKHGICNRDGDGHVKITVRETDNSIRIIVSDDGVGFDPCSLPEDGKSHVGIENVRKRLAVMCGGSLTINSTVGVGTAAIITIPKEADV